MHQFPFTILLKSCMAMKVVFLVKYAPYRVKTVTVLKYLLSQTLPEYCSLILVFFLKTHMAKCFTNCSRRLFVKWYTKQTHIFFWGGKKNNLVNYRTSPPTGSQQNWGKAVLCYTIQQMLEQSTAVGTDSSLCSSFSIYTRLIFGLHVICYNLYECKH